MYPTVIYSKIGLENHAFYQVDDHHMSIIEENRQMTEFKTATYFNRAISKFSKNVLVQFIPNCPPPAPLPPKYVITSTYLYIFIYGKTARAFKSLTKYYHLQKGIFNGKLLFSAVIHIEKV